MSQKKTLEELRNEIEGTLTSRGVDGENAALVARSLAWADARGTRSHGVNMLEAYLERIEGGGIAPNAQPTVLSEDDSHVVMDGQNGFGQVAVYALWRKLAEKMSRSAIACGSVRNSNHCGALAFYTEEAAKEGYIALLFANANPTVAPFGGMEAALGTNPMSVAIPHGEEPVVLDMASSAVAKAKIYRAAALGEKIDPSWALDEEGHPTDDPEKAIHGVLTPMAGPKGYGIAVAVEALAGVLSGGGVTSQVSSVHKRTQQGMNAGAFMIVIDPGAFLSSGEFDMRMGRLVDEIKSSKPQPGQQIFMPGEIERETLRRAEKEGIIL